MSAAGARRSALPALSPRWTGTDGAAAQADRADGAKAAADAVPAEALDRFWRRVAGEGAGDLLRLYGEAARLLEDQSARRERLRQEHDTDLVSQGAANQRQYDDRMETLKRELGPEAPRWKQRQAAAEDAQRALRVVRGAVNSRPLRTQFGWFYLVVMAALAVTEVPVNRAAFELAFREEPIFSILVAAGVGIAFIFLAHVLGVVLRRWPERAAPRQAVARIGVVAFVVLLVGGVMYALARLRQAYFRLVSAEGAGFAERLREALAGRGAGVVDVFTEQPFGVGDFAFLAVNVLLFVIGAVLSYLRHDPHPDYERAVRDAARADRAFAKMELAFGRKAAQESERFEARKRSLDTQMGELQASLAATADQTDGLREHCRAARQMVAQTVRKRCAAFIDGHAAAGGGAAQLRPPETSAILAELPAFGGAG